jgi:hypothetical protein
MSKANIAPDVIVVAIADAGAPLWKLPSSLNGTDYCTAIHLCHLNKFAFLNFSCSAVNRMDLVFSFFRGGGSANGQSCVSS